MSGLLRRAISVAGVTAAPGLTGNASTRPPVVATARVRRQRPERRARGDPCRSRCSQGWTHRCGDGELRCSHHERVGHIKRSEWWRMVRGRRASDRIPARDSTVGGADAGTLLPNQSHSLHNYMRVSFLIGALVLLGCAPSASSGSDTTAIAVTKRKPAVSPPGERKRRRHLNGRRGHDNPDQRWLELLHPNRQDPRFLVTHEARRDHHDDYLLRHRYRASVLRRTRSGEGAPRF